jgi:glutamine---fructose-6-phosphate transaminase (isomerizing)
VLESGDRYLHPRITLGGLEDKVEIIRRSRRILFVACGTSFHACLAMRPLMETLAELPVVLELASDLMDRQCPIFRDDTAVFVSQSGETADTLAALRFAKSCGALCVGVTNTVGSPLSRETACGVHLNAGYEMGVASTKAYTSQCVVLAMMALLLARDSISRAARKDAIADALLRLPDAVRSALALDGRIQELAAQLKDVQSLLVFGRGDNYATALETALKVSLPPSRASRFCGAVDEEARAADWHVVGPCHSNTRSTRMRAQVKEVAQVHSEGILAGEMKHGPLALIDNKLPVVVIATRGRMYSKMVSVIQQLMARGARLIVICNEGDADIPALLRGGASGNGSLVETNGETARPQVLFVPETEESLQPVVNVVPMQLLSYHLTVLRGLNVDQPRNLAKSVTVTEH